MLDLASIASSAIFAFNDEGIILQVNPALCRLLNQQERELAGQKISHIFTIPTLIFFQTHLYPLLKVDQQVDEIFISLKESSGKEIPVVLSGQRIEKDQQTINVFSCITIWNRSSYEAEIIAARKQAENALKENSALLEAQKSLELQVLQLDAQMHQLQQFNDTLKEISNAVTHEMQEPVRKLLLYTDILLNYRGSEVSNKDKARLIMQIERIKNILGSLQSYVWLEDPDAVQEEVDLAEALMQAKKQVLEQHPIAALEVTHEHLPKIGGSAAQLTLMFYHLLQNSLKFRAPERPLEVHVAATVINMNRFKQMSDRYAFQPFYKIVYTDNGSGFDPKYSQHIFHLFKKLEPASEGTGIGLALVKKIVLHHGGTITASGKLGAGSSFTLFIPTGSGV